MPPGERMNALIKLSRVRNVQWYLAALATVLAMFFSFVIYPRLAGTYDLDLDPDLHGALAVAIWKHHAFAYFPSVEPASNRGPLYPAVLAGILMVTNGWWPYGVQLAQCLFFGLLCLLVFRLALTLWNRPAATLAAAACAVQPLLIWYTSRVWIEALMVLMFTAMMAAIVALCRRPSVGRALWLGVILGLDSLMKSTYLPFVVAMPLCLLLVAPIRQRPLLPLLAVIAAVAVLTPWTMRNGRVTGTYSPVVGISGFAIHQGNDFVQDFAVAPFSIAKLFKLSTARMSAEPVQVAPELTGLRRENAVDAEWQRLAVRKLRDEPAFLVKKLAYGAVLFWTLSETPAKSAVVAVLQLPLLALFVVFLCRWRRWLPDDALRTCIAGVLLLYAAHLPTIAVARYSVVLLPIMLVISVGLFAPRLQAAADATAPA
jgi:4-amino-4-deoxy-L-arabinose transferase-like glycosyltransferase